MNKFILDNITLNDLNMDSVLEALDGSCSSVGKEYTERSLQTLLFDENALKQRGERADYFGANEPEGKSLRKLFTSLGRTKKFSFYDYIFRIKELDNGGNALHYILILLLFAAIALIFVNPAVGIIALVVMVSVNIIIYFRKKAAIEGYFMSLKYLVSMVGTAQAILAKSKIDAPAFHSLKEDLNVSVKALKPLRRGAWLLTNSVSGSLIDVVMDYVRMIFHVDIIRFNSMKKLALGHEEEINLLYNALGELELDMNIAAFRKSLPFYCTPEFNQNKALKTGDSYNVLIRNEPVPNSIDAYKSVLLTGSNASGKSTFLRTLAVNQILAQTIYTCAAHSFETDFFLVISSMALSDNILGSESYFVVEIKSLKRIFDNLSDTPVMCFVDEVLRGTNTRERIAASGQILKKLSSENALVFAATHDIELTEILKEDMLNMHFSETVTDNEVIFDYKLKEGPANSTNAIKLLEVYGFDPEIVAAARNFYLP